MMQYDVVNIGEKDCLFGIEFLKEQAEANPLPAFVSTNISAADGVNIIYPYVLKTVGGRSVAVLGVVSEDALEPYADVPHAKEFRIEDPAASLSKVLPEVATRADIILLLSGLSFEETVEISEAFPEIDLIISSDNQVLDDDSSNALPEMGAVVGCPEKTRVKYQYLISADIAENGDVSVAGTRKIECNEDVPGDEDVDDLINRSYLSVLKAEKFAEELEKYNDAHQNLLQGLEKSPLEMMQEMQQQSNSGETSPQNGKQQTISE